MTPLTPKVVKVIICSTEGEVYETAWIGKCFESDVRLASLVMDYIEERFEVGDAKDTPQTLIEALREPEYQEEDYDD